MQVIRERHTLVNVFGTTNIAYSFTSVFWSDVVQNVMHLIGAKAFYIFKA